jgi:hypothetical protein
MGYYHPAPTLAFKPLFKYSTGTLLKGSGYLLKEHFLTEIGLLGLFSLYEVFLLVYV